MASRPFERRRPSKQSTRIVFIHAAKAQTVPLFNTSSLLCTLKCVSFIIRSRLSIVSMSYLSAARNFHSFVIIAQCSHMTIFQQRWEYCYLSTMRMASESETVQFVGIHRRRRHRRCSRRIFIIWWRVTFARVSHSRACIWTFYLIISAKSFSIMSPRQIAIVASIMSWKTHKHTHARERAKKKKRIHFTCIGDVCSMSPLRPSRMQCWMLVCEYGARAASDAIRGHRHYFLLIFNLKRACKQIPFNFLVYLLHAVLRVSPTLARSLSRTLSAPSVSRWNGKHRVRSAPMHGAQKVQTVWFS